MGNSDFNINQKGGRNFNLKDQSSKELQKKNKFIYLGLTLIVLIFSITGATYAYFALTASNNTTITGTVGGATLSLTVTKSFPTVTTNMVPQLESTLDEAISTTYSCVDGNSNVVCQVYKAVIQNTGTTSAELTGTISFQNIDNLPNLKWKQITSERTIGEATGATATTTEQTFEAKKTFAPNETATYYFVIWIDEIGAAQTDRGTFRATINFKPTNGTGITSTIVPDSGTLATQYIQDLYNDGSVLTTVNIGGDTSKPTVTQNVTQGIMLDNNGEYRYYGANPNNYITFNGELWRIISVSNVKSSTTDTTGEMRMKIIRNESIGNYSWDSSESSVNSGTGVNDWSKADLNAELNTLYLNQQSGTCYNGQNNASATCDFTTTGLSEDARNMVDDALWYLGGSSTYQGLYANDYYTFERGTATYGCSTNDGACPRATSWVGKVGLMYPSDYVYATDQGLCTADAYNWSRSENVACIENDWGYKSGTHQWTISPFSGDADVAFRVRSVGLVLGDNAFADHGVWPTLFLKSGVTIVSGEGTDSNPYQLGIGS